MTDTRWHATFVPDFIAARIILLRHGALRMVLLDKRGVTVDAWYMREGERIEIGQVISFPCHVARVGHLIQSPCTPSLHAGPGAQHAEEWHAAAGCHSSACCAPGPACCSNDQTSCSIKIRFRLALQAACHEALVTAQVALQDLCDAHSPQIVRYYYHISSF